MSEHRRTQQPKQRGMQQLRVGRTRFVVLAGLLVPMLLGGCSSEPIEVYTELDLDQRKVAATLENFFGYLEEGDAQAAIRMTDIEIEPDSLGEELASDGAYEQFEGRPSLIEVDNVEVTQDSATALVTYEVGNSQMQERLEMTRVPATSEPAVPEHYVIEVSGYLNPEPKDGKEVTQGYEWIDALPAGSSYSIVGVDLTGATQPEILSIPAFGGEYLIEVKIPGEQDQEFVVQSQYFFGLLTQDTQASDWVVSRGFAG